MRTRCCNPVKMLLVFLALFISMGMTCEAEEVYQNPDTKYKVVIEDEEDLLTDAQEANVAEAMQEITAYGNVAFLSAHEGRNSKETAKAAEEHYLEYFGNTDGVIFMIDMRSRYLYIYSNKALYKVINRGYAETITDNVYKDASAGAYATCAIEAYGQMLSLLQGQRISQPMKYVSNTLLGITIGFLLTFLWVLLWYKKHMPTKENKLEMVKKDVKFIGTQVTGETTEETYYPQGRRTESSGFGGGGSSGGFGGGGGGFGGGGSSGGGGGHSF